MHQETWQPCWTCSRRCGARTWGRWQGGGSWDHCNSMRTCIIEKRLSMVRVVGTSQRNCLNKFVVDDVENVLHSSGDHNSNVLTNN
jgi:hypothetical protein